LRESLRIGAVSAIAIAIYLPVAYGLKDAFIGSNGHLTLKNIEYIISSPAIRHSLIFTFVQATLSSIISTSLGLLGALSLLSTGLKQVRLLRALSLLPFMAPSMVVVSGFTTLYASNGLISSHIPQAIILGQGFWAVIAAHVFYNIPLALNLAYSALVSVPRELIDSVNLFSGGRTLYTLRRIILPYSRNAVLSSFLLIFIYCFISFAIPLNLGGVRYSTLEVYIYSYYKFEFNTRYAASVALLQFLVLAGIALLLTSLHGRTIESAPAGGRHYKLPFKGWIRNLLLIYLGIIYAYLYLPLLTVYYAGIRNPLTGALDLTGVRRVLSLGYDPVLGTHISTVYLNTAYYASMTLVIALALGTFIVVFGSELADAVFVSLLAVSPLTLSLGLVRAFGPYIPQQFLIVLAHSVAALPLVTRILRIGYERVRREFIEIAHVLGERGYPLFARIIYPLMKPSYLVAASIAMVISLGEFSATLFMAGPQAITLSVAIYFFRGVRDWEAANVSAALLLTTAAAVLYALSRRVERWL